MEAEEKPFIPTSNLDLEDVIYMYASKTKRKGAGIVCLHGSLLLLVQRLNSSTYPGTWTCPGGKAEKGETFRKTALREFNEETGHEGMLTGLKPIYTYQNKGVVYKTFQVELKDKFKLAGDNENQKVKWFAIDELPKDLHPKFRKCIPYISIKF